jgi:hypothetical protein
MHVSAIACRALFFGTVCRALNACQTLRKILFQIVPINRSFGDMATFLRRKEKK